MEAWINTSATARRIAGNRSATGTNVGWELITGTGGSSQLSLDNGGTFGSISGTTSVTDSQWHHVVGVRSGSSMKIYIDGVSQGTASAAVSGDLSTNAGTTRIGRTPLSSAFFDGIMDNVRFYNRALTDSEAFGLYNFGNGTEDFQSVDNIVGANMIAETGLAFSSHSLDRPRDLFIQGHLEADDEVWIDNTLHADEIQLGGGNAIGPWSVVDGLVAHYLMDDNAASTTVLDNLGGFNGTAQQNTSGLTTTGILTSALSFNGTSDYIDLGSSTTLKFDTNMAAEWWMKTGTDERRIMGNRRSTGNNAGWEAVIVNGQVRCQYDAGTTVTQIQSESAVLDGDWHHVVCAVDNDLPKLYFDGEPEGTASGIINGDFGTFAHNLYLGRTPLNPDYFNGSLDNVRFYNRPLSAGEARILYNEGVGTVASSGDDAPLPIQVISTSEVSSDNSLSSRQDLLVAGDVEVQGTTYVEELVGESPAELISLTVGPQPTWSVTSGILVFYKFEDNAANTTVTDAQGSFNGTSSTANTSVFSTTGKLNNGFSFNNVNALHVDIGTSSTLHFTGDFSIAAWVNTTAVSQLISGNRSASGSNIGWRLSMDSSGKPVFLVDTGSVATVTATTAINNGQWTFLTAVREGSVLTLYINGTSAATGSISGDAGTDSGPNTYVGTAPLTSSLTRFVGKLDNYQLFDRALTESEILGLYNEGNGTNSISGTVPGEILLIDGDAVVTGVLTVANENYDASSWDNNYTVPTKNSIRDQIEAISAVAGNDTEVQYNDSGSLGADSDMTYDDTTNILTVGDATIGGTGERVTGTNTFIDFNDANSIATGIIVLGATGLSTNETFTVDLHNPDEVVLGTTSDVSTLSWVSGLMVGQLSAGGGSAEIISWDVTPKLVSSYKLNDNAANTTVLDGHGSNNGTASANTSTLNTAGKLNSGFLFNGTSTNVDLGSSSTLKMTGDMSVECWINTGTANRRIAGNRSSSGSNIGWELLVNSSNKAQFLVDTGASVQNVASTTSVQNSAWHHLVGVRSGTTLQIWVNGVSEGTPSGAISGDSGTNAGNTQLGRTPVNASFFSGILDNVRIYNDDLTYTEIAKLYNGGSGTELASRVESGGEFNYIGTTAAVSLRSLGSANDLLVAGDVEIQNNLYIATGLTVATANITALNATGITVINDITSSDTEDIGWSIQSGANTACNTTCVSGCVHGWDTAAGEVSVACSNASADKCLCAGGS